MNDARNEAILELATIWPRWEIAGRLALPIGVVNGVLDRARARERKAARKAVRVTVRADKVRRVLARIGVEQHAGAGCQ